MKNKKILLIYGIVLLVLFLVMQALDITMDDIIAWSPEDPVRAAVFLLAVYAVKSLTVFLPLPVIYLAGAALFERPWCVLVNLAGILTAAAVPFAMGRRRKEPVVPASIKPETLRTIRELEVDNAFLYTFMLRSCHVAYDPLSLYLGSCHLPWGGYLLGTLAATGPTAMAITIIGENIFSPDSAHFWPAMLSLAAFVAVSFLCFYHVLKTRYPRQLAYLKEEFQKKIKSFQKKKSF
jgi:uncharacterized membrane protein YdjX (TVP38/TMEM64 family)